MRVLLLYPQFPKSFWSFEKALELMDLKALVPPLGLITVAAILPQEWDFKLVDRNVRAVTEAEWEWADLVILSAMIAQKDDFTTQIRMAKQRGKRVAVGGPYATALPEAAKAAGADYLVLDEGEITLPLFVEAIVAGNSEGVFRATEKPDVTATPIPRFDLLDFSAYQTMSVQFSRGCPFQCEFCDIIVLYGRKPRTKQPTQLLAELESLYQLGWRGSVFMVDDNFIGNKRNVKLLLKELKTWQAEHRYPFSFITEASVDLGDDPELLDLMMECNFISVFLGLETPDEDSLMLTKKFQNTRNSLADSVENITRAGLRVMAGFIIGFDNEKSGAGDRIVRFVEQTSVPTAFFSMLQALPDTALWHRLAKEGRLLDQEVTGDQTSLMNFIPTRPIEEIAREYVDAFWNLYDEERYIDRVYRHCLMAGAPRCKRPFRMLTLKELRALATLVWRQGMKRKSRWKFWQRLFGVFQNNPSHWRRYLMLCADNEHFLEYRQIIREQIEGQLAVFLAETAQRQAVLPQTKPEAIVS
jgi:radical SAM superfamily enzyme YgiQ (UPF0313 family)